jgi:hypothetical protein
MLQGRGQDDHGPRHSSALRNPLVDLDVDPRVVMEIYAGVVARDGGGWASS